MLDCDFSKYEKSAITSDYAVNSQDSLAQAIYQSANSYGTCATDFVASSSGFEAEATAAVGAAGIAITLASLGASLYTNNNSPGSRQDLEELKQELESK